MAPETTVERKVGRLSSRLILSPLESKISIEEEYGGGKILFLAGPTGCGKTELSLLLAKAVGGEIVSADSMQVYQGMDIGTAKASLAQRQKIPHHLIDVRPVTQPFNVVDYYYEAQKAIEGIRKRGKIPLVVGGAGFYMHALLYGPPAGPPSVNEVRRRLENELEDEGSEALYQRLLEADPDYAATITPHDRHKIVRALEIITLTGFPVSSFSWKSRNPSLPCSCRCWFLYRPREVLYQRVEERCEQMIDEGFLNEVKRLDEGGLRSNPSGAQAIGYRQALAYLDSPQAEADYEAFVSAFKRASRRYVKRQFTWFRKEPLFKWLDVEMHDLEVLVDMMVKDIKLF